MRVGVGVGVHACVHYAALCIYLMYFNVFLTLDNLL